MAVDLQELSKQAIVLVNAELAGADTGAWIECYNKHYAELIVAECINMIEAESKNADEDDVHGMRNAAGLLGRAFITLQS